jgi:hypothetical protein
LVNEKHTTVPVKNLDRVMSDDLGRTHQCCVVNQNCRHDSRHISLTSKTALSDRQFVRRERFTGKSVLADQRLQNTMETVNGLKDEDKTVDHNLNTLWDTVVIENMSRQAKGLASQI